MTTIAFIIPISIVVILSLVAHALSSRFWLVSICVAAISGVGYLIFQLAFNSLHFDVLTLGISALAAIISFAVAVLIGLPFIADRRLQRRH